MTPFSSREENCDIVCCCVRDSIALFKRLLRFWATFWNDTILARKQKCIIIIMIYTYLSKHVLFLSILLHLYKCLKLNANHGRDRYLWVLNAAVYLRDINTQFVWFYFARSLRTLSQFWRKRFSLKNIFTFAWTCSDRLRDLIILSGTLCSLPYTAILALNLYAYVNFNDL